MVRFWLARFWLARFWLGLLIVAAVTGCASRPDPVACAVEPFLVDVRDRVIPGRPVPEGFGRPSLRDLIERTEAAELAPDTQQDRRTALALSGGGPWGAFGAGFLNAWDETQGLPRFDHVTGVSTGALQAPFVFAGGPYLDRLEELYRNIGNEGVLDERFLPFALVFRNGLNSLDPLRQTVRAEIDRGLLEAILRRAPGRTLTVGLVDLDSGELLGADLIAAAERALAEDGSEDCFVELLVASASVPVFFDPVAARGSARLPEPRYLFVDGGVRASVFLNEFEFAVRTAGMAMVRTPLGTLSPAPDADRRAESPTDIYVIMNGKLGLSAQQTGGGILSIAGRTVSNLVDEVSADALYRIARTGETNGYCVRATYVEDRFTPCPPDDPDCGIDTSTVNFDRGFMRRLADFGADYWTGATAEPFLFQKGCARAD